MVFTVEYRVDSLKYTGYLTVLAITLAFLNVYMSYNSKIYTISRKNTEI